MSESQAAPAQRPAARRRPSKRLTIVLGVLAGLTAIGALAYYIYSRGYVSTDDAFIDAHITQVSARVAGHVARVYIDDNQWVEAGDVLAELDPRDLQVSLDQAQAQLQVAEAQDEAARIGVELTSVTSDAQLQEAQSSLAMAQAGVQAAQAGVGVAKTQLEEAVADVAVAQAVAEQAKADVAAAEAKARSDREDLDRFKELHKGGVIPQQQLDHGQAAADASQAALEALRKKEAAAQSQVARSQTAVASAQGNLAATQSKYAQAESSVQETKARLASAQTAPQQVALSEAQAAVSKAQAARARSAVEQAQLQLSYTRILAPVAGRVTNRSVEPGAYVQVGQPLTALVPKEMWVVANFRETQLVDLKPGQRVDIAVDAYPGEVFAGRVDSVQAGTGAVFSLLPPENATGYFVKVVQRVPVKIVFDGSTDMGRYHLGPGMSVVPRVHLRGEVQPPSPTTSAPVAAGAAAEGEGQ
jgi:membrane fusion protein (multidrug efflux system)